MSFLPWCCDGESIEITLTSFLAYRTARGSFIIDNIAVFLAQNIGDTDNICDILSPFFLPRGDATMCRLSVRL